MKNLKLTLTTIAAFFLTVTALAEGPNFVIEEQKDGYIMYLQISDAGDIAQILIEGDYSVNGVSQEMAVSILGSELDANEINLAAIQTLNDAYDYANYTVKVLNNDGLILEYPLVEVAMNDDMAMMTE